MKKPVRYTTNTPTVQHISVTANFSLMDSLVASYASSDEEEDQPRREDFTVKSSEPSSSSLFSAIPQPKEFGSSEGGGFGSSSSQRKSSPFPFSLPPPKSSIYQQQGPAKSSIPKRVVQIKLPVNPRPSNLDDEEEDEEEEKLRKKRKQMESSASHDSSVKSFLSAMPAPKSSQTLGALPSMGSGSGRRLETETPAITQTEAVSIDQNQSYESFSHSNSETELIAGVDNCYNAYGEYPTYSSGNVGYDSSSYGGNTWNGGGYEATTGLPEAVVAMDSGARRGKRGRNAISTEIVEVNQDELMKNRPRVDQVKSTGIAFGPAYQPESSSSKGKVSKLHKRKHQITALFMDMKHKESELAERRSRGLLTKAETQAKYGW